MKAGIHNSGTRVVISLVILVIIVLAIEPRLYGRGAAVVR
jgi:hypothetical protein